MKYLKKINKGFALSIIVLLILIVYLFAVEVGRNSDKPEIEKACKEYIATLDKYASMPENIQKLYGANDISNKENINDNVSKTIDNKMKELENELKSKMIDNELAIKMQKDILNSYVKNSNDVFEAVVTAFNRDITKIKKFAFDDDQVTVTLDAKVSQDIKYLEYTETEAKELSKKSDFNPQGDTITLKKVDGTWKVVYANLTYQDYNDSQSMVYYN
ncbi:MAG: hypothetical protein HFJ52_04610 [Clostridia bacterium]|nr:hypothetical protein [Clostridia bacterium]